MQVRIASSLISSWMKRVPSSPMTQMVLLRKSVRYQSTSNDILSTFTATKQSEFIGNNISNAMKSLANADVVCFDVDSTVIAEEGIDVLAQSLGKYEEVSKLTTQAMTGNVKFEDALKARLDILQPSKQSILECIVKSPFQLSKGIDSLIKALHSKNKEVYFVSGGFRIMIEPIADTLNVPKKNIFANTILFQDDGLYADFDRSEPTSADLGKPKALKMIKDKSQCETMVMVGDGATDAQAKPPADAFIGFGGVAERQKVKDQACWYVYDFEDMTHIIENFSK